MKSLELKYFDCLLSEDCHKSVGTTQLVKILDKYYNVEAFTKNKASDFNYITERGSGSGNKHKPLKEDAESKICNFCKKEKFLYLNHGCLVCKTCLVKKIFQDNEEDIPLKPLKMDKNNNIYFKNTKCLNKNCDKNISIGDRQNLFGKEKINEIFLILGYK